MDDLQRNFVGFDFLERFDDRFDGTLSVGFNDELKNFISRRFQLGKKVLERDLGASFLAKGFRLLSSLTGHLARGLFVLDDAKFQTGVRHAVQTEDLYGDRGSSLFEPLALLINQRAHAAIILTADDHIAHAQSALSNQNGSGGTAWFKPRFDDVALGPTVGIGLKLEQISLKQHHFDKFIDTLLGQSRDIDINGVATPIIRHQSFVLQLLA